jgi:membrane protein
MTGAIARPNLWTYTELKRLLSRSYAEFNEDQAPRLGAALAYYTALSLAPLLILLIALAGMVLGKEAAEGQLFNEIRSMVGVDGANAIQEMVQNAARPASGIIASLIGLVMLAFGASSVASELRTSLNTIWDQPQDPDAGIKEIVKERSYALVVVLGCGFLLVVSLVASSVIAAAGKFATAWLPFSEPVLFVLNMAISIAILTLVFAFLFKYLPDVSVQWRDVLLGAAVTAVLFTIGKFLIGIYLGKASFGSTYGAAGSLVIVLVWVYYSAQIFFFGAEFTQVYACEHGSNNECGRQDREVDTQAKDAGSALKTPITKDKPSATSVGLHAYGRDAVAGNTLLNVSPEPAGKIVGWFGALLGAVLAGSKLRGGLKK